jgi:N-acetyl-gamma-glutamyl-phosphate/LysW-gamma-L-alpha-aminoadipyl-6-phosphate reductase
VNHRHSAEVEQMARRATGDGALKTNIYMTLTSIEMVRGALATVHCHLNKPVEERDLWKVYRAAYKNEPFVRLVKTTTGIFRAPETKLLAGSNWADVGFYVSEDGRKVTALCAIDNLMKGAAGSAIQCLNVMKGWDERAGLEFTGLHP